MKTQLTKSKIALSILIVLMLSTVSLTFAQKEIKYEKIYYLDTKAESNDVTISIDNAVSTDAETKFKLKITNKTNDYIIYKPSESKFIINGKEINPQEKPLVIEPNESGSRVINTKGNYNTVKDYSFVASGLYKVSTGTKSIAAADFKLPPSRNDFKAADFDCVLSKVSKETDETAVKFKCTYLGKNVGIIMPSKVTVKMPDGNEYANAKSKAAPLLFINKGEEDSFTLLWQRMPGGKDNDMQKVEMIIKWNDAFHESTPDKLKPVSLELKFDENTSNDKGK